MKHVFLRCGFHSCLDIVFFLTELETYMPKWQLTQLLSMYIFHFQGQDQLKKLQEEMKDLLQNLGLKQSEVSIKKWKDDVLRVARGLWITNYPLFWLGRSISKPGYDVSRYSLYPVYVFVVVRCFPCCCFCCLFCGCCCCRCCCCRWCLAS